MSCLKRKLFLLPKPLEQAAPPPPEAPKVAELLEIVDDKADIEETTTIINEDNQARVEVKYVPVQVVEEEPEVTD